MSDPLAQFISITSAPASIASQYLARNDNIVENAINDFYLTESDPESYKRPTLTESKQSESKSSLFSSFSDLRNRGASSEREDQDDPTNFFTGGEKSGLAVENPNKNKNKNKNSRSLVDDLLKKAEEEAGKEDWRREPQEQRKLNKFKGQGHSLGSVEQAVQSQPYGHKLHETHQEGDLPSKVTRTITFWKEGFNVDDGELYKYDDEQNKEYLNQLNAGRAPLSLLNVKMFQDVDVNVHKRLEDSYYDNQKKRPRKFGFEGSGQRLGSPLPGESIIVEEPIVETPKEQPKKEETSQGEGDTTIQIRLANGERIIRKFNSSDQVEVIYDYVSTIADNSKPWSLALSFPMTILDDKKSNSIADSSLKNAVIIQRWK